MKGIVLAGGQGTRLYPITKVVCKQLLPIYDKPMIYYPISTLKDAGIKDILIISTPKSIHLFEELLGCGAQYGLNFSYLVQENPNGIAEAFIIAEDFINQDPVALILGDNIFWGASLSSQLKKCIAEQASCHIFGYMVKEPKRYGVLEFDENHNVKDIIEKPKNPPSRYAVTGLYFYDSNVVNVAKSLKPSKRGELEITDVNKIYLNEKKLQVHLFNPGLVWLDTGTMDSLYEASNFIKMMQERDGIYIGLSEMVNSGNKKTQP